MIPRLAFTGLILAGIVALVDLLTGWSITKFIHNANPNNKTSSPPAIVKIDENEVRKLFVSTVLDFANKDCKEISIEIPANIKFDTGAMINEAIDKTNKGKEFKDTVFFTIRVFGPEQLRPLTEQEAILQNKMYRTLPGGIVIIGSRK